MNKEKYNKLVKFLNELEGEAAAPANVRLVLIDELNKDRKNVLAIISAFYEYTNKKQEFEFLTKFYQDTMSSLFSENNIKENFENIVKDSLLLDKMLSICNDSVIENLYKHASAMNDIYVKTGDNSYLDAYNKIREKYESIKPVLVGDLATTNTNQNTSKESDPLWEKEKIENEKRKRAENMLNSEASNLQSKGVNITSEQLHDTIKKNNIDAKETEGIYYSHSMERVFEANERLQSLPFNKFTKLVEKTSGLVMKKADYDVITLDSKKSIIVSSNKKTDVLASVDEKVADIGENIALKIATAKDGWHKVVNKAYCKKVEMTKMVVDTKHKAAETIKGVMTNLKNKTNKFIKDTKDKKDEFVGKANQKIEDFDNSIRENVSNAFERAAQKLSEVAVKVSPSINVSPEDITILSKTENNKQYQDFSIDQLKAILYHMSNQGIKGQDANLIASGAVLPRLASSNGMSM